MQLLSNQNVAKHFPERETVILKFNKKDAQIARDWLKSDTPDLFDDARA